MNVKVQQYVEWYYPGVFQSDSSVDAVASRDAKALEPPSGAYAFRFYERQEAVTDGGELLVGEARNRSGMIFLRGQVFSLQEVRDRYPEKRILIDNMIGNKWSHVVKCAQGFLPFDPDEDRVLDEAKS